MTRVSVTSVLFMLAAPAWSDSPARSVPTPLERAVLQSVVSEPALQRATDATGRRAEIVRSGEIINEVLSQTKAKTAPEITAQTRTLSDVRQDYGLELSAERLGALLVVADKEERFAELQAATSETLSTGRLAEIDDELFWASFDPDRGDPVQDFETEDGSTVRIAIDPETRDTTVEVLAEASEDILPFNLALPTRWVAAREEPDLPDDANDDLMTSNTSPETSAPDTEDWSDDIFADVPVPQPEADPDHPPKILTQDMQQDTVLQLNGLWDMSGFLYAQNETWFITADRGTSNLIRPSQDQAQSDLEQLRDELSALRKSGGTGFVWRHRETGEQVRQQRYKRLDIDTYEYLGEQSTEDEVARLQQQIRDAEQRLENGVKRERATAGDFERLAAKAGPIRVRKLGPCGGVMDTAWFDGLNLGVRHIADRRCSMNPNLPEAVKAQLLGNVHVPWTAIFHIVPDPRSGLLTMRGNSWGGKVHYDQFTLKVSKQSGPYYYAAPRGERPIEDENTLLSGSAMGADDDEAL